MSNYGYILDCKTGVVTDVASQDEAKEFFDAHERPQDLVFDYQIPSEVLRDD